ncbi:aldehyde dehydrogenase family protein [Iodobacter sp. CM08]|uniref:aldehyde dehydrogenase family protein n=1 Tax=Iodobacter sp. CM08 TaxID=3085902 RepID=UPI00298279D4|nr:aldehyde dehydrogenase family protein [Iodobacter sp. CM08]MDW5416647.1 aldehyde dehydrogenase family protein [Iodobacter sp. CM08]
MGHPLAEFTHGEVKKSSFLARQKFGIFIDGHESATERYYPVIDPATGLEIAQVADASAGDADRAIASARQTFESDPWAGMRPATRERLLINLAQLIEKHGDELAAIETLESGKLLGVAKAIDVGSASEYVRYMAGWATKITGSTLDLSIGFPPGVAYSAYTRREAVGVVAAIVPWNFPLAIAIWKLAPALACGCTVVLKPAQETPLTALRLAELVMEAGFPAGALNVLTGSGSEVGEALTRHPGIDKISFTGSTSVGKQIAHAAADNLSRVTLELGGKSPMIVMADMEADVAAQGAAMSIFFNQGQVCTAASRLFVQRSKIDEVVERLSTIANAMKLGSGFDPESQMGPLISQRHMQRVMAHIEEAKQAGGEVTAGGCTEFDRGYFVRPTVFINTSAAMRINQEEVFGPVVTVTPFDEAEEAIQLANDSAFGLAASIWTHDLHQAHRFIPKIKAGMVWVNTHNMLDNNLPLGGVKQSGFGRDLGHSAIEQFTELKSVCIAY